MDGMLVLQLDFLWIVLSDAIYRVISFVFKQHDWKKVKQKDM